MIHKAVIAPVSLAITVLSVCAMLTASPTPARAAAVLSLTQAVSGTTVVGQSITFTVTMTNTGTDATFQGFDDNTPAGVTIGQVRSTGTSCAGTHGNALITCSPTTIAPGASVSLSFAVQPTTPGTLTNTANGDPDFLVSSQTTVQVAPAPTDVQVTGSASTGSPNRGATFSYTFQVKDNGPWSVGDVTFSDPLPSQVGYVGTSVDNGAACAQVNGTVSCDLGGLNVGQQVNVVVTVVAPTAPATFTNTATVTPSVSDTQPSNNSVGVTVQVK